MKCQIRLTGKNKKKNISNVLSAEFDYSVLSDNIDLFIISGATKTIHKLLGDVC